MPKYVLFFLLALAPFAACANSADEEPVGGTGDASADTGKADTSSATEDSGVKPDSGKKDAGKDTGPKDAAPPVEDDSGPFEDCDQGNLAYLPLVLLSKKDCASGCDGATECCFRNSISPAADRCVPKLP